MSIEITLTQYVISSSIVLIPSIGYMYYLWNKGKDLTADMYINAMLIAIFWPFFLMGLLIIAAGMLVLYILKKLEVKGKTQTKPHINKVINRTNIPKAKD